MSSGIIYIVDDDESVRLSTALVLETSGFKVETYPDAAAFLAAASPPHAAVGLFDLRMPGMDGLDLLREIRARGLSMPIILVSGHTDATIGVRAITAGAFDVVEKPYEEDRLLLAIRRALAAINCPQGLNQGLSGPDKTTT